MRIACAIFAREHQGLCPLVPETETDAPGWRAAPAGPRQSIGLRFSLPLPLPLTLPFLAGWQVARGSCGVWDQLFRNEGAQLRIPRLERGAFLCVVSVAVVDPCDSRPRSADVVEDGLGHLHGDTQRLEIGGAGPANVVQPLVWKFHLLGGAAILDLPGSQMGDHVVMERCLALEEA
jgi:hypothetical protein